ncbi:MAG: hypothetical protein H7A33_07415 [Deltaproteobacteria bacterium]|nr:hypothetical protein [Deltaproteobacteria bacterium]
MERSFAESDLMKPQMDYYCQLEERFKLSFFKTNQYHYPGEEKYEVGEAYFVRAIVYNAHQIEGVSEDEIMNWFCRDFLECLESKDTTDNAPQCIVMGDLSNDSVWLLPWIKYTIHNKKVKKCLSSWG